jgi:DNA-binding response OmpR family regulator
MAQLRGKRILLVEDEPIIALMLEDMLGDMGIEVVGPASTLEQALVFADDPALDAAILDVNLNGQQSHPVAERLKARGIPFLFATGYGSVGLDDMESSRVIHKPYRQERISAALEQMLGA